MRITNKIINMRVEYLNELTGNATEAYVWDAKKGHIVTNVGCYHVDQAYGGFKLVQMHNEHGAISDVSKNGYGTKRQLYDFINAFIAGIELSGK